jgi:hypothetical protein
MIHQTPPRIRVDWFKNTGHWTIHGVVTDESAAIERIRLSLVNPCYDLFGHNCVHFARFVATGKRESTQVVAAVVGVTGIALVGWLAFSRADAA